jgi:hypothetical protein
MRPICKVFKEDRMPGLKRANIGDTAYWKYILSRDKYLIGIKEGYFNSKNELLGYTEKFESFSIPVEEGAKVVLETLKMILKDIKKDSRILDERLGVKKCVIHFNKQRVKDLASRPVSLKRLLRKPNKSK